MRLLLGGYTADMDGLAGGIGVLDAGAPDDVLAGGDLAFAGVAVPTGSPSWVARHPSLEVVYAAQEGAGTVQAFVRTGERFFTPRGEAKDAGAAVCHVAVAPDGSRLVASCWGDGQVVSYPLGSDGRIGPATVMQAAEDPYGEPAVGEAGMPDVANAPGLAGAPGRTELAGALGLTDAPDLAGLVDFTGLPLFGSAGAASGARDAGNGGRIDGAGAAATETGRTGALPGEPRVPHAHQARFLPGGIVVTTDMGWDLVRFWRVDADAGLAEMQRVVLPRGSGPRHTVWHPSGHLYVVTEVSNEVFVLAPRPSARPAQRWAVAGAASLSPGTGDYAAEIALTRDGQFALAGIRGSNTLATLRVRDGGAALAPVALAEAGVDWPRHHLIARDTVLVAGQRSDEVVSLTIDERTGFVGRVRRRVQVPTPTCLMPLP